MCYESLLNGEAAERSVRDLLREERRAALRNGLAAAVLVVAVLIVEGAAAWTVVALAVAAVALGAVLHQAVLVAGAAAVRVRHRVGGADRATA
ncbi:hypothetical protein HZS55_10030 [Halosimplex rubrum]|uniref:Uncharacterized protein n=1 Tax=Halosimplex rubrum TaxID=869889 RepID=A0A7D5T6B9_9EURY|nr:hypothetical protein [Halosimplex rubrum]QLH77615.1 hypothetical protein HZS55_10030 [Halosimplex rubrum]